VQPGDRVGAQGNLHTELRRGPLLPTAAAAAAAATVRYGPLTRPQGLAAPAKTTTMMPN